MQICLLCDRPIVADTLRRFLTDLGHNVVSMPSLPQRSDMPEGGLRGFDSAIVDLRLPVDKAFLQIGELRKGADIPVLMAVDGGCGPPSDRAVSCGIFAYLRRPISLHELDLLLTRLGERRGGPRGDG